MDEAKAYKLYFGLKTHFRDPNYDFFKYGGRGNWEKSTRAYEKYIPKLAKIPSLGFYLISNFVVHDYFLTDLIDNRECKLNHKKKQSYFESLTYQYGEDLKKFKLKSLQDIHSVFDCKSGTHPKFLRLLSGGHIQIETVMALMLIIGMDEIIGYLNKHLENDLLWPTYNLKLIKYRPFVEKRFDVIKLRNKTIDIARQA